MRRERISSCVEYCFASARRNVQPPMFPRQTGQIVYSEPGGQYRGLPSRSSHSNEHLRPFSAMLVHPFGASRADATNRKRGIYTNTGGPRQQC